jgi:hypothetical protein
VQSKPAGCRILRRQGPPASNLAATRLGQQSQYSSISLALSARSPGTACRINGTRLHHHHTIACFERLTSVLLDQQNTQAVLLLQAGDGPQQILEQLWHQPIDGTHRELQASRAITAAGEEATPARLRRGSPLA